MIHWYSFYLVCLVSVLGVIVSPSIRRISIDMVCACAIGYMVVKFTDNGKYIVSAISDFIGYNMGFNDKKVGFAWAITDIIIASTIINKYNIAMNRKPLFIASIFACLAICHTMMTLAVIDGSANLWYNNYELMVAFFNIAHAIVLMGGMYHDLIRLVDSAIRGVASDQYSYNFAKNKRIEKR